MSARSAPLSYISLTAVILHEAKSVDGVSPLGMVSSELATRKGKALKRVSDFLIRLEFFPLLSSLLYFFLFPNLSFLFYFNLFFEAMGSNKN